MKISGKKKTKLRFKNKSAAVVAVVIALFVLMLVCLAIFGIVKLAQKNEYKDVILELHPDFTITASSESMDSTPNTLSYIKNAATCGAEILEVDLLFNSKGEPVLTDNFDNIDADATVPLIKAFEVLKDYPDVSIMLDLHGLTNLARVEELAEKYNMFGRIYYSGVTPENVEYVTSKSPNIQYFINVEIGSHSVEDGEFYDYVRDAALNAYAINIDFDDLDSEWAKMLLVDGFRVSADNVSSDSDFRKALNMNVANIITDKPGELQAFIMDWLTGA